MRTAVIDDVATVVKGRVLRIAAARDEPYECVPDPPRFLAALRACRLPADVFTFCQPIADRAPRYSYRLEWDSYSVLTISTFDHWWKRQINDKTRNMVRKAGKKGVSIRTVPFDDALVRGIESIYDESPVIQGKPNRHFRKGFAVIEAVHATFPERSEFLGAYWGGELIGFVKLLYGDNVASLLSIISKAAHRDKAPTNALLARAVERCSERGIENLHYGLWSRRGLGEFKKHHAFARADVPRYYVPLTRRGRLALALGAHRKLADRVPERWLVAAANLRDRWNAGLPVPGWRRAGGVARPAVER
jgi:hypothetical protein